MNGFGVESNGSHFFGYLYARARVIAAKFTEVIALVGYRV
jgi:hypothetical protein